MAQDHDEDYSMLLKVMVVGDQAVGKTSLISRFVAGTFAGDSVVGDIGVKMQMRSLRLELPNATKVVRFQFVRSPAIYAPITLRPLPSIMCGLVCLLLWSCLHVT
eukprot:TRINITY_DN8540_c0_g1_i1.p1 TRINITY_DN8540_c0_g1~~TRINITY_DN8540_c0_g1_i1.p1  ORF type:complete len:105 (-),score=14.85 TRINITY_DN8540_c0_g1_i1:38-352(-)